MTSLPVIRHKKEGQEASPSKCVSLSTSRAARMTAWRLGTNRLQIATIQVLVVGASPLGFQRMFGMVKSKYLPGGSHGCEGDAVSVTALSSFRSAISRAVWSKKLPMTHTPTLLSLLDGPDPAFFIWNRFRQHRRCLAYRTDE